MTAPIKTTGGLEINTTNQTKTISNLGPSPFSVSTTVAAEINPNQSVATTAAEIIITGKEVTRSRTPVVLIFHRSKLSGVLVKQHYQAVQRVRLIADIDCITIKLFSLIHQSTTITINKGGIINDPRLS